MWFLVLSRIELEFSPWKGDDATTDLQDQKKGEATHWQLLLLLRGTKFLHHFFPEMFDWKSIGWNLTIFSR